jgi:2-succinyl-5-enolpyruvyl-6-hydroxy-3-cyclohexene-1-carboxylate synthase
MSVRLSKEVLTSCARLGVREFVICAGARNAALIATLAVSPGLRLWSFPEERSAGFFALGRVMATARPVAIITTSGTAVAELLPAVIEAYYQGQPLLVISADRPAHYRGTGAPQAIEQLELFGLYAEDAIDVPLHEDWAERLAAWSRLRPLQLNVCLEEPSAEDIASAEPVLCPFPAPAPPPPFGSHEVVAHFIGASAEGLLVMLGSLPPAQIDAVREFLRHLGALIYAEGPSHLRECPQLAPLMVRAGDVALKNLTGLTRVLRLGGVPACRFWRDLEDRPEIRVLSLTPTRLSGLARSSQVMGWPDWAALRAVLPIFSPVATPAVTVPADDAEGRLVRALSERIPPGSDLFLGNSLPIRLWNAWASTQPRTGLTWANRGANGIEGAWSTFLGLAADREESWAIVGDLTALYDLAAPWVMKQIPRGKRRLVIIHNGGGKIFRRLPSLRSFSPPMWQLMENPHSLSFAHWAAFWGLPHVLITQEADWEIALMHEHVVIELVVPQEAD